MDLPKNGEVEDALISLLKLQPNGEMPLVNAYELLTEYFGLTEEQVTQTHESSNNKIWETRVRSANKHLSKSH